MPRALASILGIALMAVPASAAAELARARETRCTIGVQLAGPIATVTEVHELVAATDQDADGREAIYTFALPAAAAVTGARITPPGGREARAVAVSRDAFDTATPNAEALGIDADLGLVRWLGGEDGETRYEARAAPLDPKRPLRLAITWTAPAAFAGGRLVLRVPARGDDEALARCEVTVATKPAAGVRGFGPVFVNGARSAGATAVAAARALEVEVAPVWSGAGPIAAWSTLPVGESRAITSVAVYVPPPRAQARFAPQRLVLIVDTSRSLGAEGRAGALAIADALVAAVPPRTPVEVIAFDRTARRLLGGWVAARDARGRIAAALAAIAPAGGSDLAEALHVAGGLVGDGEPTAIVAITDGILASRTTGADLVGHAKMAVPQVTIDAVVPLVPGAPLLPRGPLDELVTTYRGQVVPVRTGELGTRAAHVAQALATAAPLRDLSVTLDGDPLVLDFPDELAAGEGAIVHAVHPRHAPRKVALAGTRSAAAVAFTASALPAGAGALAIAAIGGRSPDATPLADGADLFALGRAHGVVTPVTGLAILDTATRTGAARAALARDSGVFTRTAPPEGRLDAAAPAPGPITAAAAPADHGLPASTYQYLIKYQLWPQVRACYQDALLGKPRFGGTLDLTLELARGEVHDVRIAGDRFPEAFIACVATATYAIEVPSYPLDDLSETIAVVHKPIFLRPPVDPDGAAEVSEELLAPADLAPAAPPPVRGSSAPLD